MKEKKEERDKKKHHYAKLYFYKFTAQKLFLVEMSWTQFSLKWEKVKPLIELSMSWKVLNKCHEHISDIQNIAYRVGPGSRKFIPWA